MATTVGINGFGRIGRNILRAIAESGRDDIRVVAINDLAPVETNAHLFAFDSVHAPYRGEVTTTADSIDIGDGPIRATSIKDPAALPWGDVDIALECTGRFKARDQAAAYLEAGAKRVLISAPGKGADKTIVYGVNDDLLTAEDHIVSNASCTTNCLAPVAKALNDAVGIVAGSMTTIHAYTGDQPTLDTMHSDLYRARAAAMSMIPTTTGAARTVGLVLPELEGRLDGAAMRVPTPNVSCVDLNFVAGRATTADEINEVMRAASDGPMGGVLAYEPRPLVSIDFNHHPASAIFAPEQTRVMNDTLVRVLAWYDNEWAFSMRMVDTAVAMGALIDV